MAELRVGASVLGTDGELGTVDSLVIDPVRAVVTDVVVRSGPEAVRIRLVVTKAPAARGQVIFESEAHWSILAHANRRTFVDRDASGPILAVHFEPGGGEVLVECAPVWLSPGSRGAIRAAESGSIQRPKPQSITCTSPNAPTITLLGLRSPCTTPWACTNAMV